MTGIYGRPVPLDLDYWVAVLDRVASTVDLDTPDGRATFRRGCKAPLTDLSRYRLGDLAARLGHPNPRLYNRDVAILDVAEAYLVRYHPTPDAPRTSAHSGSSTSVVTVGRPEVLVAYDYSDTLDRSIDDLVAWLDDALVDHVDEVVDDWRGVRKVRRHRVTFDATRRRNTEVHGFAFRLGFVAHIE